MDEQYLLKTLVNAVDVLSLFEEKEALTPKEIEERMGMNRTNIFRILYTLRHKGLLDLDPNTGEYRIGIKMIHLASLSIQRLDIKNISHPYLKSLKNSLNETVHLVILKNNLATFIDKIDANEDINMGSYIGWSAPVYCTASGKLLLSFESDRRIEDYINSVKTKKYTDHTLDNYEKFIANIEEIRRTGFSSDNEEMVEGLTCYAVPIKGHDGKPIAAISVSGPTTRMTKNKSYVIGESLQTAEMISRAIMKTPQGVI